MCLGTQRVVNASCDPNRDDEVIGREKFLLMVSSMTHSFAVNAKYFDSLIRKKTWREYAA